MMSLLKAVFAVGWRLLLIHEVNYNRRFSLKMINNKKKQFGYKPRKNRSMHLSPPPKNLSFWDIDNSRSKGQSLKDI